MLSLGMFAGGLGFATWLLMAEPVQQLHPSVDVADLWTELPRTVDTAAQDFARVPGPADSRDPADASRPVQAESGGPVSAVDDDIVTGAVENAAIEDQPAAGMAEAHVEWCTERYRSYRVRDNSYQPYRGGRRTCVSPHFDEMEAEDEGVPPPNSGSVIYAAEADGPSSASVEYLSAEALGSEGVPPEHIAYCFSRYRTYRPEDNTYQPYGGGPRRQCR